MAKARELWRSLIQVLLILKVIHGEEDFFFLRIKNYIAVEEGGEKYTIMDYIDYKKEEINEKYMKIVKNKYPEKQTDLELRSILTGESYPYKEAMEKEFNEKVAKRS